MVSIDSAKLARSPRSFRWRPSTMMESIGLEGTSAAPGGRDTSADSLGGGDVTSRSPLVHLAQVEPDGDAKPPVWDGRGLEPPPNRPYRNPEMKGDVFNCGTRPVVSIAVRHCHPYLDGENGGDL